MLQNNVSEGVQKVFKKVFSNHSQFLLSATSEDIAEWDSLNHVILIRELEAEFNLSFDLFEVLELHSVGQITDFISARLS